MKKILFSALFLATTAFAAETITVPMTDLDTGKNVGEITATQSQYGVVFTPDLTNLPMGLHGFHMHTNPSCASSEKDGKTVLGGAAGGHFDPMKTGSHGQPWSDGNHLGDLPALYVSKDGDATHPVLAPRLKLSDLHGHSLMIHVHGDNYSNTPKLGGGGARLVCGVIK